MEKFPVYLTLRHISVLLDVTERLGRMPRDSYTQMMGEISDELAKVERRALTALSNALFEAKEDA